ncbi:hypothetical protein AVEN_224448-1 [Araneus ventricosus]|uniref:Uncharacterized protein n=1 Tax=Araneus ventricosus TaxID=182803 RepID=A0A4Y2VEW1_ARAVE|nr:hypothetical protein AVEN_220734-1 [Araneus ventricosus]GBO22864.1 hypothetical protein AVEN_224448-1 [Araneus ventricosus]
MTKPAQQHEVIWFRNATSNKGSRLKIQRLLHHLNDFQELFRINPSITSKDQRRDVEMLPSICVILSNNQDSSFLDGCLQNKLIANRVAAASEGKPTSIYTILKGDKT